MLEGLLRRWAHLVYRFHVAVVGVLLALTLLASLSLLRLELQADVRALLPDDDRAVNAYFELKESFGADLLVIVLEDDEGPILEHADYVDSLAIALGDSALIESVDYRVYENIPTGLFLEHLPLLLTPDKLDELASRLQTEAIRRQVWLDRIDLQGPMLPPRLKQLLREDPLRLLELLKDRLVGSRGGYALNVSSGYYVSHDDSTLLLFAKPTEPSDDIPYAKELILDVEAIEAEVRSEYAVEQGLAPDAEIPGLRFGLTGAHAIAATESVVLQKNTVQAIFWSLVSVLVLFVLTFKRIDAVIFVGVPLVASLAWTCGITYLAVGRLNLVSTGFAAVVLGLGVDYAIHVYNRFLDHRRDGDDTHESLEAAVTETGRGVFIGALTTSGAFFALMLYDFKGVREFGFIAGSGVLLSLFSMLTLLPAMLALRERWRPDHQRRVLARFYSREIVAFVEKRPGTFLIGSIIVTAVLGAAATQVRWQGRVLGSDFSANPALQLRERVREQFSSSPDSLILLLEAGDLDALDRRARVAHEAARHLVEEGRVGSVDSIYNYLRSPAEQREVMVRLQTDPAFEAERVKSDFHAALTHEGFRVRAFSGYFDTLDRALQPESPLTLSRLREVAADNAFIARYVTGEPGDYTQAIYLASGPEGFERTDLTPIEDSLVTAGSGLTPTVEAFLAGGKMLSRTLRARMREGFAVVTFVALSMVLAVLAASFRHPGRLLLALVPLTLGITWMLGVMALCGEPMNVINVPVTAMILGIGIDDAVHVVNGFFREYDLDIEATYRTTGKALVLTTLTTVAGFGSLALAGHPALQSMGLLAILGCASCLLATLLTVPAIMVFVRRRAGR